MLSADETALRLPSAGTTSGLVLISRLRRMFRVMPPRFDRVFDEDVIYFWADPLRPLQEIQRVLRPDGVSVIAATTPQHRLPQIFNDRSSVSILATMLLSVSPGIPCPHWFLG